mmetsp:Transcript_20600/g.38350  ORF Transcript_20600/g.38350 Transcript_20600/m.38350 type:complete len:94 (+) Transcript_20600:196-477(+)
MKRCTIVDSALPVEDGVIAVRVLQVCEYPWGHLGDRMNCLCIYVCVVVVVVAAAACCNSFWFVLLRVYLKKQNKKEYSARTGRGARRGGQRRI